MPKIVVFTGGRDYADRMVVRRAVQDCGASLIVEGGAPGADTLVREEADRAGIWHITVWALWKTMGKAAGMARNRMMLKIARKLHLNVEVHAFPGGIGTNGMKNEARKAGIPVIEHA